MKIIFSFLVLFSISSCASSTEGKFTASTPAHPVVRTFLGISASDSVDFIRWKLAIEGDAYKLHCNYGIGKPNTNGFMNGGKTVEFQGNVTKNGNLYSFLNGNKKLNMIGLNSSLLHILDGEDHLLGGTGGWGYTLNSESVSGTDDLTIIARQTDIKDSIIFQGRTPCRGLRNDPNCYKLKWLVTLYTDPVTQAPTRFFTGTVRYPGEKGSWSVSKGKDGRVVYNLKADSGETYYLLKLDENVLIFTDASGKLLVGDHDFGYTLSRTDR